MTSSAMKILLRILPLLLLLGIASPGRADLINYSGPQNIPIPLNFEGIYLRLDTGATSATLPANWDTAPWLNPFFGGVFIGNSPLLRPFITSTDQILNLAIGTVIDANSDFVLGESGSTTHVGPAANQFQIDTPGIIGFALKTSAGAPDRYGWMGIEIDNIGAGRIIDWAYEDTPGTGIIAGMTSVPEPSDALVILLLALPCMTLCVRQRRRCQG
jgi:hypothetical protein